MHNFPSEFGDLLITFDVEFPRGTLSAQQAQLVREALMPAQGEGRGEL